MKKNFTLAHQINARVTNDCTMIVFWIKWGRHELDGWTREGGPIQLSWAGFETKKNPLTGHADVAVIGIFGLETIIPIYSTPGQSGIQDWKLDSSWNIPDLRVVEVKGRSDGLWFVLVESGWGLLKIIEVMV